MYNRDCINQETGNNETLKTQGCPWNSGPHSGLEKRVMSFKQTFQEKTPSQCGLKGETSPGAGCQTGTWLGTICFLRPNW